MTEAILQKCVSYLKTYSIKIQIYPQFFYYILCECTEFRTPSRADFHCMQHACMNNHPIHSSGLARTVCLYLVLVDILTVLYDSCVRTPTFLIILTYMEHILHETIILSVIRLGRETGLSL
jgi:hypothetical protein